MGGDLETPVQFPRRREVSDLERQIAEAAGKPAVDGQDGPGVVMVLNGELGVNVHPMPGGRVLRIEATRSCLAVQVELTEPFAAQLAQMLTATQLVPDPVGAPTV